MKLNIEELIGQSNEAAKLALDYSLHEGFDRERMKAFARLIVERCAQECGTRKFKQTGAGEYEAASDCEAAIRNLMED